MCGNLTPLTFNEINAALLSSAPLFVNVRNVIEESSSHTWKPLTAGSAVSVLLSELSVLLLSIPTDSD